MPVVPEKCVEEIIKVALKYVNPSLWDACCDEMQRRAELRLEMIKNEQMFER